jgi:spore coat protein U-like protein
MAYTAAASGDSITALAWGIVRSLGINSPAVPGKTLFVSALTPGLIVTSYAAANRPIGVGLAGYGVLFNPNANDRLPEQLTSSIAIAAVTGSLHLFSASAGRFGWNRQTVMIGNSANLVELKWYSDSARTKLLYATISGGVSVVGSFQDRAGWPWENTDASTLGDLVYGSLKVMSAAAVGSDTISVQQIWDRHR